MKSPIHHPHPAISTKHLTGGQRAADRVTTFLGSWAFITIFSLILFFWIGLNLIGIWGKWDPAPFILLNLLLSCFAAIQAPIILMSQNRSAERMRQTAAYDYAVDRKAERKIEEVEKELREIKKFLKNDV